MMTVQVLQPAVELAEEGFPVAPVTAYHWQAASMELRGPGKAAFLNPEGRAPGAGRSRRTQTWGGRSAAWQSMALSRVPRPTDLCNDIH